jgi:hypothetical protein
MRVIYYLTLSVQRHAEPAILLDIEFPDVPTLNAMLAEVHEADLSSYILATSGERKVKFSHRMVGDALAAEFREAAAHACASDALKTMGDTSPVDMPMRFTDRDKMDKRMKKLRVVVERIQRGRARAKALRAFLVLASLIALGWLIVRWVG